MPDISCPSCGEEEDLNGTRRGDVIDIACGRCGEVWTRDPRPVCAGCGSTDLRAVPRIAVVEKVRGNQYSPVGTITDHLCPTCDRDELDDHHRTRGPLPPKPR